MKYKVSSASSPLCRFGLLGCSPTRFDGDASANHRFKVPGQFRGTPADEHTADRYLIRIVEPGLIAL